jgi:hypothetical protein
VLLQKKRNSIADETEERSAKHANNAKGFAEDDTNFTNQHEALLHEATKGKRGMKEPGPMTPLESFGRDGPAYLGLLRIGPENRREYE